MQNVKKYPIFGVINLSIRYGIKNIRIYDKHTKGNIHLSLGKVLSDKIRAPL